MCKTNYGVIMIYHHTKIADHIEQTGKTENNSPHQMTIFTFIGSNDP